MIDINCLQYLHIAVKRKITNKKHEVNMKKGTFKGGIHPYDGKKLTKNIAVKKIEPGSELIFPMSQHIGAEALPQVKVGDRVLKGQLIGKGEAFVSANIHSSVSGKVLRIEPRLTAGGTKVMSVVIENDGLYEDVEYAPEITGIENIDKSTIIGIPKVTSG